MCLQTKLYNVNKQKKLITFLLYRRVPYADSHSLWSALLIPLDATKLLEYVFA